MIVQQETAREEHKMVRAEVSDDVDCTDRYVEIAEQLALSQCVDQEAQASYDAEDEELRKAEEEITDKLSSIKERRSTPRKGLSNVNQPPPGTTQIATQLITPKANTQTIKYNTYHGRSPQPQPPGDQSPDVISQHAMRPRHTFHSDRQSSSQHNTKPYTMQPKPHTHHEYHVVSGSPPPPPMAMVGSIAPTPQVEASACLSSNE